MSDPKQARLLLEVAEQDLAMLRAMKDESVFVDRAFGFAVQQAVEKILKAWICVLGSTYPHTHNLEVLMRRLAGRGEEVESFSGLVGYTPYAGMLRYQPGSPAAEPLGRESAIAHVGALLERVKTLAEQA